MEICKDTKSRPHPRANANPISALFFWWTHKIFVKGFKRDLETDDLYDALIEHKSELLGDCFQKRWGEEMEKVKQKITKAPSLLKVMFKIFGIQFMGFGIILLLLECIVKVAQPILLGLLIRYFSPSDSELQVSKTDAYYYAAGVVTCSALSALMIYPTVIGLTHMGWRIRVGICSLIYRKSLRLSHFAMGQTTVGQAINLISNDVTRFDYIPFFLHYIWIGLVQTILISYLLWKRVGISALTGVVVMLLTIPMQVFLGKLMSKFRTTTAGRTDERIRLMNEILSGIQVIKMYTWEKSFAKLVATARRFEIQQIRYASHIRGTLLSLEMFVTRTSIFASLVAYVLCGNNLTAEKVFVLTSFYNILRLPMTLYFPLASGQIAECLVSIKRIKDFLLLDEVFTDKNESNSTGVVQVKMTNAHAKWSREHTLSDINISVRSGSLLTVIGTVGAGKTSLLSMILGELPVCKGSVKIEGVISYAGQESWIFSNSIRQNILFGEMYDPERYKQVISVCALETDLHLLSHGDQSLVGERGLSLSGGQKARVNLARAIYKKADIYLLDDPLSAVDAHVSRHLFNECIRGFLRDKCVILVTHQLQYLNQANNIVVLKNGCIEMQGTFAEMVDSGLDFASLLGGTQADDLEKIENQDTIFPSKTKTSCHQNNIKQNLEIPEVEAELRTKGTVTSKVYARYFTAGGGICGILIAVTFLLVAQLLGSGADYWVSYWTTWEEMDHSRAQEWLSTEICIFIYTAIIVALIAFSLIRAYSFFILCMSASKKLHHNMFSSITRTTMAFFNNNPSGFILILYLLILYPAIHINKI